MFKILICDDESRLLEAISDYFTGKGVETAVASNGEEAINLAIGEYFDLIILDVMMPFADGFEVCKRIKSRLDVPVIMLTAKSQEQDYLKGYSLGCDDYIAKPFPLSVLYEKAMLLIRKHKGINADNIISVSGVSINVDRCTLTVDGKQRSITSKDFQILKYLMENKNIVISRELIITHIWGYDFNGDDRIVDAHIKAIRKALADKAGCLKTVINFGYCFQEVQQ